MCYAKRRTKDKRDQVEKLLFFPFSTEFAVTALHKKKLFYR